jgi:hypothetical protein
VTVVKHSATSISDDITMADIPRKNSKVQWQRQGPANLGTCLGSAKLFLVF